LLVACLPESLGHDEFMGPDAARLRAADADAASLLLALPRLSGADDDFRPVTLDLGQVVTLRASAAGPRRTTELALAGSAAAGRPLRVRFNRRRLLRSPALGFREVVFAGIDRPVQCRDDRRCYAWVLLDAKAGLPPGPDDLRIASTADAPPAPLPPHSDSQTRTPIVTTPHANGGPGGDAGRPGERPEAAGYDGLLEEALALQDALRAGLARSGRLLAALKQHRRQGRLVESTLATLRQLQPPGR
jgi:hypothetical protein